MKIAVLTSGGDAPGMNAAIRAVVRTALYCDWEMLGVRQGYAGLITGQFTPLGPRDVGGIIQQGGTVLGTARSPEFHTPDGQRSALHALTEHEVDDRVVIGGNGSQAGANALSMLGFPVVGIASTIDNDLYGADITLGVAAGRHGILVGMRSGGIVPTPLSEVVSHRKTLDLDLLDLARVLAI